MIPTVPVVQSLSPRVSLALLALVSASAVAAEVLLTRLLSVVAWYGLAFLVLSLAMLGLTHGALLADRARRAGEPIAPWLAAQLLRASLGLGTAVAVACNIPLSADVDVSALAALVLLASACTFPLAACGAIVTRLMAESLVPLPRLYAVDLGAAALGALVPLALLGPFTAASALVAIAILLAATSFVIGTPGRRGGAVALVIAGVLVIAAGRVPRLGLEPRFLKGNPRPSQPAQFERWNALSYVYVSPFAPLPFPLWSPSPTMPNMVAPIANAYIDGEAGTPVYAYSDLGQLNLLKLDATTTAHVLRPDGTACVIGIGGGRDLEAALVYGHDSVHGIEINPSMVQMLREIGARSPILDDPRVHVTVGDGRSTLAQSDLHCRVLQASLVDTWAATGAGAFAHTESTLYTREAWGLFLRRVEPDGILTFSRWYDPQKLSETARLVSLAMAALIDRGAAHPANHLALIAAGRVATILASPVPFTAEDVAALEHHASRFRFQLVFAPGHPPPDALLASLLDARDIRTLDHAGDPFGLDTSPPTDDRPFFFHLLAPRAWRHPFVVMSESGNSGGVLAGNVRATFELLMTFLAVAIVGGTLLGPTLVRAMRRAQSPLPGARSAVYFGALGTGFMLAEIALVQRMHVVLGHPTYSLVVVLAGLLVATGLGSALSTRVVRSRGDVARVALVAAVLLAALPFAVIGPLARHTEEAPLALRVVWTGTCAALVGVVLGMLFPSGLRFVARDRGAPVALAVNGATSVLGSVGAVLVSVWAGIPASFALAGAVYALAAFCGPHGWRDVDAT